MRRIREYQSSRSVVARYESFFLELKISQTDPLFNSPVHMRVPLSKPLGVPFEFILCGSTILEVLVDRSRCQIVAGDSVQFEPSL